VVNAKLKLRLKNRHVKRAETLDGNFLKTGETKIADDGFTAPEDALYLLLLP
jgi:hypothetical protein